MQRRWQQRTDARSRPKGNSPAGGFCFWGRRRPRDVFLLRACPVWQTEWEGRLQAAEETEKICGEDLVFLFGMIRESGRLAYRELQSVLDGLKRLEQEPPKAAALLTGTEVYGKRYGTPRAVREEEMGYVSHLLSEDTGAFCMRTAEHMAARFAKEKGLPVKILRVFSFPETPEAKTGWSAWQSRRFGGFCTEQTGRPTIFPGSPVQKRKRRRAKRAFPVPIRPDFGKWEQLREERRLS